MLLTITTTHRPATDLGYLLHKHPGRLQSFRLPFGRADVFYPEAVAERCTAALLLDIDPPAGARSRGGANDAPWQEHYINDRPYVASSQLSVAIAAVFGSALAGKSRERPTLVEQPIPLAANLPTLPSRAGPGLIRQLFEPLGYAVAIEPHLLDASFPEWGDSPYFSVTLTGETRVQDLLAHLYVLLPVLDDAKHYWVGDAEVDKLLRFGAGWLDDHPQQELISSRYLKHQRGLVQQALAQLLDAGQRDPDETTRRQEQGEARLEAPLRLGEQRIRAVLDELRELGTERVLDLGCGEGRLIGEMLKEPAIRAITGLDVSHRALELARTRLHLDTLPSAQRERVDLIHGSLTYRDQRLAGHDAAVAMEVMEHIDPARLGAFEETVFAAARPGAVLITTPNAEYNALFPGLPAGEFRHQDHRFEWTRAEFQSWARVVAERRGYDVRFGDIGPTDVALGPPTQLGVFTR